MVSVSALASLTLFIFTAVCAVSDCLSGKISNSLILCGAACALVSRAGLFLEQELAEGISFSLYYLLLRVFLQIADAAAGFLVPYLLLGVLVLLRMLGGGDVKMLSVIGLQLGLKGCVKMIWYSFLAAALVSVLIVFRRRNLSERMRYLGKYVSGIVATGRVQPYRSLPAEAGTDDTAGKNNSRSGEFPFAVPVLLAAAVYLAEQLLTAGA